ncbi:MAG: hypothetical protein WBL06_06910 [Pseudolysinimonas sp.]|uniref:hypothetical protein n=1 Tax=Pseudolysinimonas sp. TaxID=2680009 RepID=UPI003C7541B0
MTAIDWTAFTAPVTAPRRDSDPNILGAIFRNGSSRAASRTCCSTPCRTTCSA